MGDGFLEGGGSEDLTTVAVQARGSLSPRQDTVGDRAHVGCCDTAHLGKHPREDFTAEAGHVTRIRVVSHAPPPSEPCPAESPPWRVSGRSVISVRSQTACRRSNTFQELRPDGPKMRVCGPKWQFSSPNKRHVLGRGRPVEDYLSPPAGALRTGAELAAPADVLDQPSPSLAAPELPCHLGPGRQG